PNFIIIPVMLEQLSSTCKSAASDPISVLTHRAYPISLPVHREGLHVEVECSLAHAVGGEVTGRAGTPSARDRAELGVHVHDLRGTVRPRGRFQQILE
ncbi:hypothetical protein PENTCL1PPCAC_14553, partial [Pristionchus entomophagus]